MKRSTVIGWDKAQPVLARLAAEGKSAAQAAALLGVTRNAALGRAYRTGIKFTAPKGRRPKAKRRPGAGRKPMPLNLRAGVVAAMLAGMSSTKAGKAFGVSHVSAWKWAKDEVVRAKAQTILHRALEAA